MATQPAPIVRHWFDEPAAARVIAQINPADFVFDYPENFLRGDRQWVSATGVGFAIEADLSEMREAFVADEQGCAFVDLDGEPARQALWLEAYKAQVPVSEVIGAAIAEANRRAA